MKTIVVPINLANTDPKALPVAADIARLYGAQLILISVIPHPLPQLIPAGETAENTRPDPLQTLEQLAGTLQQQTRYQSLTIKPTVTYSDQNPAEVVAGLAPDLIVLGARNAGFWQEWASGTRAESMVRQAPCPVLVVKQPIAHFNPQKPVGALDLDEGMKKRHVLPFGVGENGLRQFVYVSTPADTRSPEQIRDWVGDWARMQGYAQYELAIRSDRTVSEGILHHADQTGADLIILYTHGRAAGHTSVAETVLRHAHVPVLIMRM
ncbi:universal stress protein [Rudanella paleaurantiibacter]|uniref:Universal stress protein n=1 Tax=Rudanella paleaurantiibacter TaxID=2614655 RepID=A0A7J5TY65_9BACT|nr:universal stress protein [Rudanella paleaurantiibacter]KAB7730005.1 universal stress protein [Rudanella paleaurantiibacter]